MIRGYKLFVCISIILFLLPLFVFAKNYFEGSLLRAEGDIKVYLINNNIKRWISSVEVFNLHNFKWQNVKVIPKNEIIAIKEGSPIVLESVSPTATFFPTLSVLPEEEGVTPTDNIEVTPFASVRVNDKLPAPEYIRADWLISHITSDYGRIGQRIVFKYSNKGKDRIENFNLYEKKPGDRNFNKIANFEEVLSTGCEDIDIDGEWMMIEAGQCGYWSIQKIAPPGARGAIAYLPASDYLAGEYVYYVAGADKDGAETPASGKAKLVFLDTVSILSPADGQPIKGIYPIFKWSVASTWPAFAEASAGKPTSSEVDYFIMISDDKNAQNPVWTKQLKIIPRKAEEQFVYDGLGLNPAKKYKTNIYGHYRKSEYDPDFISISFGVPEFWIKPFGYTSLFRTFLRAFVFQLFTW